jgi:hypothetical protein
VKYGRDCAVVAAAAVDYDGVVTRRIDLSKLRREIAAPDPNR